MGKVSRWPLKMRRRPPLLPRKRATRLTIRGCGSTRCTSIPGMLANRPSVALAMATVSLGGLGEATRTKACVMSINLGRLRSTSPARISRTFSPLLVGKAALPEPDAHRQRPADEKIDHGNKAEELQRTEGRGRQLHAAPRDLAHRNHRPERGELDELHEVRGQRRQGHADRLRQDDTAKGLHRRQPQDLGGLTMPFRYRLD